MTSIGARAFYYCSGLTSVTLGDNITSIGYTSFPSSTKLYTKHKTKTLFALWNRNYNNIYEQETSKSLAPPYLNSLSRTQTSFAFEIGNMYSEYIYKCNGENITNSTIEVKNLYPGYSVNYQISVIFGEMSYIVFKKIFPPNLYHLLLKLPT